MLEHHAYLYRSSEVKPESAHFIVSRLNLAEVNYILLENFGINDVRSLTEKAFVKPLVGDKQLIVVCTTSITVEAQQALLKILEEPPITTVFLFCIPNGLYLLPTLLSRFQEENNSVGLETESTSAFLEFVTLKIKDRIIEISNRLAKKDTIWVDEIKVGLLNMLVKDSKKITADKLTILYWVAEHLQTRGASNKLLLEELALTLE